MQTDVVMTSSATKWNCIFYFGPTNFLFKVDRAFDPKTVQAMRLDFLDQYKKYGLDNPDMDSVSRSNYEMGLAPNAIRLSEHWYSIWKQLPLKLWDDRVAQFNQVIFPPMLRTVQNEDHFVAWHQDEAYMKGLGDRGHKSVITCFIPMNDNPSEVPTLEFGINPSQDSVEHLVLSKSANNYDIDPALLPTEDNRISFKLNQGDALFFGQHVLHQTYWTGPKNYDTRTTIEFRLTRDGYLLDDKDYYDLKNQSFYKTGGKNA